MIFKQREPKEQIPIGNSLHEPLRRVERCTECRGLATRLTEVEVVEQVKTIGFKEQPTPIVTGSARLCIDCVKDARKKGEDRFTVPLVMW